MIACHFFKQGRCTRANCRFFHPSPTNPSRDVRELKPKRVPKVTKITTPDGWNYIEPKKTTQKVSRPSQIVASKNPFKVIADVVGEEPKQLPMTRKKSWVEMMEEEEAEMTDEERYAQAVFQASILSRYR